MIPNNNKFWDKLNKLNDELQFIHWKISVLIQEATDTNIQNFHCAYKDCLDGSKECSEYCGVETCKYKMINGKTKRNY